VSEREKGRENSLREEGSKTESTSAQSSLEQWDGSEQARGRLRKEGRDCQSLCSLFFFCSILG